MAAKKTVMFSVKKSKYLRTLGALKPSMGDGLIWGAVLGFLLGLAIGINRHKSGEDLGTFALEYGIRASVVCAFIFGIYCAFRLAIKV